MNGGTVVALMGPSGVGKSSTIRELVKDYPQKYSYVVPFTTRQLREGEIDKAHVEPGIFQEMMKKNEIVLPNNLFGSWYGPPRKTIDELMSMGMIALIDWPVHRAEDLKEDLYPQKTIFLYIWPLSLSQLKEQLSRDNRDANGIRFNEAVVELQKVGKNLYPGIDELIISYGTVRELARTVNDCIDVRMQDAQVRR
jgi:guanylate kinase